MIEAHLQFFFGSDNFFVEAKVKAHLQHLQQTSIEKIDGQMNTVADLEQTLKQVIESLRTVDFFEPRKCVWLSNTNLFANTSPATAESAQTALQNWLQFVQKLPTDTYLFISASAVDKRTRLFKSFQKLAQCIELEDSDQGRRLLHLIEQASKKFTTSISSEATELLIQKLNGNPQMVLNEFEKLACLNNFQGTISRDCVLKNTPTIPNDVFFEPVECFYAGDFEGYERSLRNHFLLHKEIRSVLALFQNRNRLLLQIAYLRQNGSVTNFSKQNLDTLAQKYNEAFGPLNLKHTFCLFTQNPWYVSRLKTVFSLKILEQLQIDFVKIFDKFLQEPKNSFDSMLFLAQKARVLLKYA